MLVDSVNKKKEQKKIIDSEVTDENTVSTGFLSTQNSRFHIQVPKTSKTYQYLRVDKKQIKISGEAQKKLPDWEQLDNLVEIASQMREEWAEKIFEEFVARMSLFYPEKKEELKKLRQLILWQVLEGEELTEAYYEQLKKLR